MRSTGRWAQGQHKCRIQQFGGPCRTVGPTPKAWKQKALGYSGRHHREWRCWDVITAPLTEPHGRTLSLRGWRCCTVVNPGITTCVQFPPISATPSPINTSLTQTRLTSYDARKHFSQERVLFGEVPEASERSSMLPFEV